MSDTDYSKRPPEDCYRMPHIKDIQHLWDEIESLNEKCQSLMSYIGRVEDGLDEKVDK